VVYYFVIAHDGSRYGPADIDTLVQWTREGRIVGHTPLIERGTDRELRAQDISAIAAELSRHGAGFSPASTGTPAPAVTIEREPRSIGMPNPPHPGYAPPPPPPTPIGVQARRAHGAPYLPRVDARGRPLSQRNKIVAAILGIFFGTFGAHRFYLGYYGIGLFMLLLSLIGGAATFGYGCGLVSLWGFIEGIICLFGGMKDADGLDLA